MAQASVTKIPYQATGRFSELVRDHLADSASVQELRTYPPDLAGVERAAAERRFPEASRKVLVAALRAQYAGIEVPTAVEENLVKLADPQCLTVTTGHQLNILTGPLYVPFKLLNAVRTARTLEQRLGRPVVPVFWMATEDHDRPEIDHTVVNGHTLTWPGEAAGAVGRMPVDDFAPVLEALERHLGEGRWREEVLQLARTCYAPGHDLARATRLFVQGLFGRYGLVVLDGDDPALKRLFIPVMRTEAIDQVTERAVHYANERIQAHYKVQAHARPINLFHLRPGHRSRIVQEDDLFRVLDNGPVFTAEELLKEIERRPESFSPNVLLRPVYQELVLPNVVYIGGGGELAYWLQLRWVFQALQVPMPVLLLRTSALLLGEKELDLLQRTGLKVEDLFLDRHVLRDRVAATTAGMEIELPEERKALEDLFRKAGAKAAAVDPTLARSAEASATKAFKALEALEARLRRAARRKSEVQLARLERVLEAVFPGGGLQERRDNVLPLYAAHGPDLFDAWLQELDPLDGCFTVLLDASVPSE